MYTNSVNMLSTILAFFVIPLFWSISKRVFKDSRTKQWTANVVIWATFASFIFVLHAGIWYS